MANTTHGLPYPLGTDRVSDGDNVIQSLAQALDPAPRTGLLVASTGWTVTSSALWRMGPLCVITAKVTRTGADIAAASGGNITDTAVCSGVPVDMQPPDIIYGMTLTNATHNAGGRMNGVASGAGAGTLVVATCYPGVAIATGLNLDLNFVYVLP